MASNTRFYFYFGGGVTAPSTYTGLSPTLSLFNWGGITALPAPGITELASGQGIYGFEWGITQAVAFVIDGGATLTAQGVNRYIVNAIDPTMSLEKTIGYIGDSYGTQSSDPSSLAGYAARALEFNEGDKNYSTSSSIWAISSRGSSTLLRDKVLVNNSSGASSSGT